MPKGWRLVQLVHAPGGADQRQQLQEEEEGTLGPAARNVSRSTLQREAKPSKRGTSRHDTVPII